MGSGWNNWCTPSTRGHGYLPDRHSNMEEKEETKHKSITHQLLAVFLHLYITSFQVFPVLEEERKVTEKSLEEVSITSSTDTMSDNFEIARTVSLEVLVPHGESCYTVSCINFSIDNVSFMDLINWFHLWIPQERV